MSREVVKFHLSQQSYSRDLEVALYNHSIKAGSGKLIIAEEKWIRQLIWPWQDSDIMSSLNNFNICSSPSGLIVRSTPICFKSQVRVPLKVSFYFKKKIILRYTKLIVHCAKPKNTKSVAEVTYTFLKSAIIIN